MAVPGSVYTSRLPYPPFQSKDTFSEQRDTGDVTNTTDVQLKGNSFNAHGRIKPMQANHLTHDRPLLGRKTVSRAAWFPAQESGPKKGETIGVRMMKSPTEVEGPYRLSHR